jgi:hypothetical protein
MRYINKDKLLLNLSRGSSNSFGVIQRIGEVRVGGYSVVRTKLYGDIDNCKLF